ncbi:hypothetical protein F4802DRAFT_579758 [Xylaria palmicola]|nr:hypothetical protein F4802DRAFT_579758 [Xylaria palmicola]
MLVLNDGKVAKLRASCDSCNESKVRCSQTKPQCGRCVRQGIACIYGLSRRSHKTAPRVGATEAAIGSYISGQALFHNTADANGVCHPTPSATQAASERATPAPPGSSTTVAVDAAAGFQDGEITGRGGSCPPSHEWPFIESVSLDLSTEFDLPSDSLFDMSTDMSTRTSISFGTTIPTDTSLSSTGGSPLGFSAHEEPRHLFADSCNCRALVVKQLLSLSIPSEDGNNTLETHFAQLKHAISVSETCLNCHCISRDDMSIMIIGILIGRIIEGLDAFMRQANHLASPILPDPMNISESSSHGGLIPRLSWGLLEIEPDEEAELKHHLCLIQLRKLRGVLKKLSGSVDLIRRAEGNGNSAKAMTCQCIHMWLMQKAELLQANNAPSPLAGLSRNKDIGETG